MSFNDKLNEVFFWSAGNRSGDTLVKISKGNFKGERLRDKDGNVIKNSLAIDRFSMATKDPRTGNIRLIVQGYGENDGKAFSLILTQSDLQQLYKLQYNINDIPYDQISKDDPSHVNLDKLGVQHDVPQSN